MNSIMVLYLGGMMVLATSASFKTAEKLFQAGKHDEARKQYQSLYPDPLTDVSPAAKETRKTTTLPPQKKARILHRYCYYENNLDRLVERYKRIFQTYTNYNRHGAIGLKLARLYWRQNNMGQTKRVLNTLLENTRGTIRQQAAVLKTRLLAKIGNPKDLTRWRQQCRRDKITGPDLEGWFIFARARSYYRSSDYKHALRYAMNVDRQHPKSPARLAAKLLMAKCYDKLGHAYLAKKTYRFIVEKYPHSPERIEAERHSRRRADLKLPFDSKKKGDIKKNKMESRYYIQVASYLRRAGALEKKKRINVKNSKLMIIKKKVNGKIWHKVVYGPFSSMKAAKRYRQYLRQRGLTDFFIFKQ